MSKGRVHPIDRHVGRRVRLARLSKELSQTALADASGVTFQQVQKYENGTNRISASRLFMFSNILGVEVSYFFEGTSEEISGFREEAPARNNLAFERVDMDILRTLWEIEDGRLKRKLLDLIDVLPTRRRAAEPAGKRESN